MELCSSVCVVRNGRACLHQKKIAELLEKQGHVIQTAGKGIRLAARQAVDSDDYSELVSALEDTATELAALCLVAGVEPSPTLMPTINKDWDALVDKSAPSLAKLGVLQVSGWISSVAFR